MHIKRVKGMCWKKNLETSAAQITKAEWLRKTVEKHTVLGKMQNVARRIKINESSKSKKEVREENITLNRETKQTYLQEAGQMTKQKGLTESQKKQIREEWDKKIRKGEKTSEETTEGKRMRNLRST